MELATELVKLATAALGLLSASLALLTSARGDAREGKKKDRRR